MLTEWNFDGLVGPTHNYAGLSPGNLASVGNRARVSHPRRAALEGLGKMRFVASLGVAQAVLPPHPRPDVQTLKRVGFRGSDEEVLAQAFSSNEQLVRLCASASAMWTANAATATPSTDTADGRLHLTPANLQAMFHRTLEPAVTTRVLRRIFASPRHFVVNDPLPPSRLFADEGGANHTRLETDRGAVHLLAWGRRALEEDAPTRHPARQTREASEALMRLHGLDPKRTLLPRQHPSGIDAGAFHTDVVAVGTGRFLMLHALAFAHQESLLQELERLLGPSFVAAVATEDELPIAHAIAAYPFNSQLVTLADASLAIIAPVEARENEHARRFLERVVREPNPVASVHYLDVRESMQNGGGPACLRLRVPMTDEQSGALDARVALDDALFEELERWVTRHYREELHPRDLGDPALHREQAQALDELTRILHLGTLYDFQRDGGRPD